MATDGEISGRNGRPRWTRYMWAGAAVLLSIPFIAMRFTTEVNWSAFDLMIMGALLAAACGIVEVAARRGGSSAYKLDASDVNLIFTASHGAAATRGGVHA